MRPDRSSTVQWGTTAAGALSEGLWFSTDRLVPGTCPAVPAWVLADWRNLGECWRGHRHYHRCPNEA